MFSVHKMGNHILNICCKIFKNVFDHFVDTKHYRVKTSKRPSGYYLRHCMVEKSLETSFQGDWRRNSKLEIILKIYSSKFLQKCSDFSGFNDLPRQQFHVQATQLIKQ